MEWLKDLIAVGACKFKPIVPRPNRNSEFHFLRHVGFAWQRGIAIPYPTLVSDLSRSERMTYQQPNDPTRRTYTDPVRLIGSRVLLGLIMPAIMR
jgi:hypothetical protein